MVAFGFDTVAGMRNASRQGKAKKATDRMVTTTAAPTEEKPLTNTSGTAKPKGGGTKELMKQIEFGQKFGGSMGAVSGFMGLPFTKKIGGQVMTVDTRNQAVVTPGTPIKAPAPTAKKAPPPPAGTGIDAPAPDTGWRPSGTNTALGLQQTQMGVPLQETIGVSKRKR